MYTPTGKLKRDLDAVFSKYIRAKYAKNGFVRCYTCDKRIHVKEAHAGHFVSRTYLATRWDEHNVKVQCRGCNIFGGGKPLDFEEKLKKELGTDVVEALKQKRHQITILDRIYYQTTIDHYKKLLKEYERA